MEAIERLRQGRWAGARPGRAGEASEPFAVLLLLAACVGAGLLLLGWIEAPGALPF